MKKICIAAAGTRGDIFPMLALARSIKGDNEITVISPPENEALFREAGFGHLALGDDFTQVVKSGDLIYYRGQIGLQFDAYPDVYKRADVIVEAGLFYAGRTLAQYYGKKYYHIFYTPQVIKSDSYAPPGVGRPFGGKMKNRLLWVKSRAENDFILKGVINAKREGFRLEKIKSVYDYFIARPGTVIAADRSLAQLPPDCPEGVKQINFFCHEGAGEADEKLLTFLENGSKAVLISFGSAEHTAKYFKKLLSDTLGAVLGLGLRAAILSNARPEEYSSDKNVFFCDYAPHAAVLPKVSAAIHHGGIGTIYAALKSGTPQVAVPQMLDQYYWAEILERKKLGGAAYSDTDSYKQQLASALSYVLENAQIRENVERIKNQLNSESYRSESMARLKAAMPECF